MAISREIEEQVIRTQHAVEDHLVGRMIEDSHLVEALLAGDDRQSLHAFQKARAADRDLVHALRHHIDALEAVIAALRQERDHTAGYVSDLLERIEAFEIVPAGG